MSGCEFYMTAKKQIINVWKNEKGLYKVSSR